MDRQQFRDMMQISDNGLFSDMLVDSIIQTSEHKVESNLKDIIECVILYNANRVIRDKQEMEYYKAKILAKLEII